MPGETSASGLQTRDPVQADLEAGLLLAGTPAHDEKALAVGSDVVGLGARF
jgi:hypothetical protein